MKRLLLVLVVIAWLVSACRISEITGIEGPPEPALTDRKEELQALLPPMVLPWTVFEATQTEERAFAVVYLSDEAGTAQIILGFVAMIEWAGELPLSVYLIEPTQECMSGWCWWMSWTIEPEDGAGLVQAVEMWGSYLVANPEQFAAVLHFFGEPLALERTCYVGLDLNALPQAPPKPTETPEAEVE